MQALAVEPRLAAVDVAHVEKVAERGIFRCAVVGGHEDMMLRRDGDGDGVVEHGWRGIGAPVHGIDADVGGGDDGYDVTPPIRARAITQVIIFFILFNLLKFPLAL